MSEFNSPVIKLLSAVRLTRDDQCELIADKLGKVIENNELTFKNEFIEKEKFSELYAAVLHFMYPDSDELRVAGITTDDAESLRKDSRFHQVSELVDSVKKIRSARDLQELNDALVENKKLMDQFFVLQTGEFEFLIMEALRREETKMQREISSYRDELLALCRSRQLGNIDVEGIDSLLNEIFGNNGIEGERNQESNVIRVDFSRPSKPKRY